MAEREKVGFLATQIELAQKSIESWPKWLQEATGVDPSSCDEKTADSDSSNQHVNARSGSDSAAD